MENTDSLILFNEITATPLINATHAFQLALAAPHNDLNRDASIQRFEFTFELAWKLMKRILKFKGIMVNSPRDTFREAAKLHLIVDPEIWFVFLEQRNRTLHTYNEKIAEAIYQSLPEFKKHLDQFIQALYQFANE